MADVVAKLKLYEQEQPTTGFIPAEVPSDAAEVMQIIAGHLDSLVFAVEAYFESHRADGTPMEGPGLSYAARHQEEERNSRRQLIWYNMFTFGQWDGHYLSDVVDLINITVKWENCRRYLGDKTHADGSRVKLSILCIWWKPSPALIADMQLIARACNISVPRPLIIRGHAANERANVYLMLRSDYRPDIGRAGIDGLGQDYVWLVPDSDGGWGRVFEAVELVFNHRQTQVRLDSADKALKEAEDARKGDRQNRPRRGTANRLTDEDDQEPGRLVVSGRASKFLEKSMDISMAFAAREIAYVAYFKADNEKRARRGMADNAVIVKTEDDGIMPTFFSAYESSIRCLSQRFEPLKIEMITALMFEWLPFEENE